MKSNRLHLRRRYKEEKLALRKASQRLEDVRTAQEMAQVIAQQVQQQAHERIASIVSRCLEAVFDDPYTFEIEFERKRGRTEAQLHFVRDGIRLDPLASTGGGVVDVAAFALRLSCVILARPVRRRLLVLDEPFRFVSREHLPRVRAIIQELSEELDVQILQVTHIPEMQIGKVIEL